MTSSSAFSSASVVLHSSHLNVGVSLSYGTKYIVFNINTILRQPSRASRQDRVQTWCGKVWWLLNTKTALANVHRGANGQALVSVYKDWGGFLHSSKTPHPLSLSSFIFHSSFHTVVYVHQNNYTDTHRRLKPDP